MLAAFLAVLGHVSTALCQNMASISGQVTTENGSTLSFGVTLQLETSQGQLVAQQPADSAGQYEFDGLQKRDYQLVVTAKGYQTQIVQADLRHSADNLNLNIQLTPKNKIHYNKGNITSVAQLKIPRRAKKQYKKGLHAFTAHHFSKAQSYFQQATQDYPCYSQAQAQLATVLIIRKKHLSQAKTRLRKAIKCDGAYLNAYEELAQLLNAEGEYAKSVKILQQGISHSPDLWQFHYQMGLARYGMKDYPDAEKELQKVSSLDKKPPPILYVKLANVYVKESKYNDAYGEMKDYLQAKPDGSFAPRIRVIMKQMKAAGVLNSSSR